MITDKLRVFDGWDSLAAGMDAGRRPSLIEQNQCAVARDVAFRGGVPKSRPGIRKLELEFEGEIYYDPNGDSIGPTTITDGEIPALVSTLMSNTAMFTQADVGSVLEGPDIAAGTFIASVESATQVTMSPASPPIRTGVTVTILRRTNPPTFVGDHTGSIVISDDANFTQADVGRYITGGAIPPFTFIIAVNSPTNAVMSQDVVATESGITMTIFGRTGVVNLSSTEAFHNEPFQCAGYYAPLASAECIMATLGGRLFQITPSPGKNTAKVREIPLGRRNNRNIALNYMVQADRWHITQDGEALPIIFDGVNARRAGPDEVIVGKIMAYGIGRLVVTRGRDIYFGDLFGSHAGDPSDSVLKFTETNFLSEGFPAEIPYTQGEITAAAFFPSQDTSTGQGELVVFTGRGAVSFDLHLPRDQWKSSIFQQLSLINSTARGHRAVVQVNSDLWIRSDEGWRAYRQARVAALGWYQLPQSTEVSPWTNTDTPKLLAYGSAICFNNRLIVTCNPVPNNNRLYHAGLLSLDFQVLSTFGQASKPAWDGHWSKLKTLQLVSGTFSGKNRAFAFGLDEDNATQLYEISVEDREDFDGPITSEIEFRSHNFNAPFNEKNLYGADIWLDDISPSAVSLDLTFRPDSSAAYLPWKTFSGVRPPGNCGDVTCGIVPTIGNGFAPRLKIGKPSDDCDDYSGRLIRRGFEFQPKLRWTGHAALRRMRLQAMQEEEDPKGEC